MDSADAWALKESWLAKLAEVDSILEKPAENSARMMKVWSQRAKEWEAFVWEAEVSSVSSSAPALTELSVVEKNLRLRHYQLYLF